MIRQTDVSRDTIVYLDYGSEELGYRKDLNEDYIRVISSLIRKGIWLETRLIPKGTHCEASWGRQIPFFMNTLLYDVHQ